MFNPTRCPSCGELYRGDACPHCSTGKRWLNTLGCLGLIAVFVVCSGGVREGCSGGCDSGSISKRTTTIYQRNDFQTAVAGATKEKVRHLLGNPHSMTLSTWRYLRRTANPATGETDQAVDITFERNEVATKFDFHE